MPSSSVSVSCVALAAVLCLASFAATPSSAEVPPFRVNHFGQPIFGCHCSDFIWNNGGVNVGQCLSVDLDGRSICYLHQPNDCPDALNSRRFRGMQVTKLGCRLFPPTGPVFFSAGSTGVGGGGSVNPRDAQSFGHSNEIPDLMDDGDNWADVEDEEDLPVSLDDDGDDLY